MYKHRDDGDPPSTPPKRKKWEDKIPRSAKMISVQTALKDMVSYLGLEQDLEGLRVFEVWDEVVGSAIADVAQPLSIKNHQLVVAVSDPSWRHELTYLTLRIIEKINEKLGAVAVSSIRFDLKESIEQGSKK